jgi:hypothetical protein
MKRQNKKILYILGLLTGVVVGCVLVSTPAPTATALPPTATPTATPPPAPASGLWKGTTNDNHPISFEVSVSGDKVVKFLIENIEFFTTDCGGESSGTFSQTTEGLLNIINDQFSFSSENYSFKGQFTSSTTAMGTYEFAKLTIKVALPPTYSLKDCSFDFALSGTWTAETP